MLALCFAFGQLLAGGSPVKNGLAILVHLQLHNHHLVEIYQ